MRSKRPLPRGEAVTMSMLIIMLKLSRLTEDAQNHFLKAMR